MKRLGALLLAVALLVGGSHVPSYAMAYDEKNETEKRYTTEFKTDSISISDITDDEKVYKNIEGKGKTDETDREMENDEYDTKVESELDETDEEDIVYSAEAIEDTSNELDLLEIFGEDEDLLTEGEVEQTIEDEVEAQRQLIEETLKRTTGDSTTVSRGMWLEGLLETFNLEVSEKDYSDDYFLDVIPNSPYYNAVMSAVIYGLIDTEEGRAFGATEACTREYATHTLNLLLGYANTSEEYTFSEAKTVKYPDDIQVAVDRNWFPLYGLSFQPSKVVTQADMQALFRYATAIQSQFEGDDDIGFEFKSSVIDLSKYDDVRAELIDQDEDGYYIYAIKNVPSNLKLKVGDIFGFQSGDIPVAKKITRIISSGTDYEIATETPKNSEAYVQLNVSGVEQLALASFKKADDSQEVSYIVGGSEDNNYEDGTFFDSVEQAQNQEISAIQIETDLTIAGDKEIDDKKFELPGTRNVKVSVKLSDLVVHYEFKLGKIVAVSVTGTATITYKMDFDAFKEFGAPKEIVLGSMPVLDVGFIKLSIELDIQGSLEVVEVKHFSLGVEITSADGFRMKNNCYSDAPSISTHMRMMAGLNLSFEINFLDVLWGELYAKTGIGCAYDFCEYNDAKVPLQCENLKIWGYYTTGWSVGWDLGFDFLKGSEKGTFVNYNEFSSPLRINWHYEDNVLVESCTRAEDWEAQKKKPIIYYSGKFSKYGHNGSCGYGGSAGTEIYTYTLNGVGEATITGYNGSAVSLDIPEQLDGHTVVAVGLSSCIVPKDMLSSVRTVIIPDTVTKIGANAFKGCTSLKNVNLSDNLVEIGVSAFQGCKSLASIDIPESLTTCGISKNSSGFISESYGVFKESGLKRATFMGNRTKIPNYLFAFCDTLEQIRIPDTVSTIGTYAFAGNISLKTITIPKSVTAIDGYAFYKCEQLTDIIFEEGLPLKIGDYAFCKCISLSTLSMSDSITELGAYAFNACSNLTSVSLSHKLEKLGTGAFSGCSGLSSICIPLSLKECGRGKNSSGYFIEKNGVFYETALRNVTFEEGRTEIPAHMFAACGTLENIELPDTILQIGSYAFDNASGLTSISIPNDTVSIGAYAFRNCQNLKGVTLGTRLDSIGNYAFANCIKLTKVDFGDSLSEIGDRAFAGCSGIQELNLPQKVKKIGSDAFNGCSSLKKVFIPKSLNTCGRSKNTSGGFVATSGVFANTIVDDVQFEEGVTQIPAHLFASCSALQTVEIPDTVSEIGSYAFQNAAGLEHLAIPCGVKTIGAYAFAGATSLMEVVFSDGLETIGEGAFNGCSNIKRVSLPDSVKNINKYGFYKCGNLEEVQLPESIQMITAYVFGECAKLKKLNIPGEAKTIQNYAFYRCSELAELDLSMCDQMTQVDKYAFGECANLEKVILSNTISTMGDHIFYNCSRLTDVIFGNGLTIIPQYAFANCGALEQITIPYSVTKIDNYAFNACTKLTSVTIPRSTETFGTSIFSYPSKMIIYGIAGTEAEAYALKNNIKFVNREIHAESAKFAEKELKLVVGGKGRFIVNVTPANFTDSIIWKIDDETIATVNSAGQITAKKVGKTSIYAYFDDEGNVYAEGIINVVQPVTSVSITPSVKTLEGGESVKLAANVSPSNADNKVVEWSSSNEDVAIVSDEGLVTALTKGVATITAKSTDGSAKIGKCVITVSSTAHIVDNYELLESAHNYSSNTNEKWIYKLSGAEALKVTFDEQTYTETNKDYIYIYDKNSKEIGKYSGNQLAGKTVEIEGDTIQIKLISDSAINKYGFKVIEVLSSVKPVPLKDIRLSSSDISMKTNSDRLIEVEYLPENTTVPRNVTWTSADETIATVSGGVIHGVSDGSTIITASINGKTASCNVRVWNGIQRIILNTPRLQLLKGQSAELLCEVAPADCYIEKAEEWECSVPNVVSIKSIEGRRSVLISAEQVGETDLYVTIDGINSDNATRLVVKDEITLDYCYGEGDTRYKQVEAYYGTPIEALQETLERENYIFMGWYTEPDGKGTRYTAETPIGKNVWTLYACWKKREIGKMLLAPIGDEIYTGKALKPEVLVYDGTILLSEGEDYTVAYKNNTKVGNASVTITGKGNYVGKVTGTFQIKPYDITGDDFYVDEVTVAYNKKINKPIPELYCGKTKLRAKTDYKIEYTSEEPGAYEEPGSYDIKLTGIGNYQGTRNVKVFVTKEKLISKLSVVKIPNQTYYEGNEIRPDVVLKDGKTIVSGSEYMVAYQNNREIGTATVIITGVGRYRGIKRITFNIIGDSIAKARTRTTQILDKDYIQGTYVYTGNEIKPAGETGDCCDVTGLLYIPATRNTLEKELVKGKDYYVEYQKNVQKGTATIIFTGINGYTGTLKKTFKINPYDFQKDLEGKLDVQIKDREVVYAKGGAVPTVEVYFEGIETPLVQGRDYAISLKNNKALYDLSDKDAGFNDKKAPQMTIKGLGNFAGSRLGYYYKIVKKDMALLEPYIIAPDKVYSNKKGNYTNTISVFDIDGKKLVVNKDYFVTYEYDESVELSDGTKRLKGEVVQATDIVPIGTELVAVVKGIESAGYMGEARVCFKIVGKTLEKANVKISDKYYTGNSIELTKEDIVSVIIGREQVPSDAYEIVSDSYEKNRRTGTASVLIKGITAEYGGEKRVTFKIKQRNILENWTALD